MNKLRNGTSNFSLEFHKIFESSLKLSFLGWALAWKARKTPGILQFLKILRKNSRTSEFLWSNLENSGKIKYVSNDKGFQSIRNSESRIFLSIFLMENLKCHRRAQGIQCVKMWPTLFLQTL